MNMLKYSRVDLDDIVDSSPTRRSHKQQNSVFEVLHRISVIITPILLTVICILLILQYAKSHNPASSSELLGVVQTRYGSNFAYMSLDHRYDEYWDEELHPQNGIIRQDDGSLAAISMFHQIHCLTSFRKALQNAKEGVDIGMNPADDAHWPHCLWYVRQAILCFADDTLEMAKKVNGTSEISGQDDLHQCRDSGKLYALRDERGIWKEP